MKVKKTIEIAKEIITFAEMNGWSEEELAKAIKLLHSETTDYLLLDDSVL